MKLATERQKEKLTSLGIDFDSDLTLEDAAELIRENEAPKFLAPLKLNISAMAIYSTPDGIREP